MSKGQPEEEKRSVMPATPQDLPMAMGELGPPAFLTNHLFFEKDYLALMKEVANRPEFIEQGLQVIEHEEIPDGRIKVGINPGDHKGKFLGPFWDAVDALETERATGPQTSSESGIPQ